MLPAAQRCRHVHGQRHPGNPAEPAGHVDAADADGDGDPDLLLGMERVSTLPMAELLRNDGGVFVNESTFAPPSGGGPAHFAQIDSASDPHGRGRRRRRDPDLLDGFDITVNFQRQMTQRAPIRPGDALRLEFVAFGTGVVTALPVLTLQRLPRGLPAFGGTWFLDPGASALLGAIASSAGQSGTLSIAIPNTPAIVGLGAQLQGLVVEANGRLALTNHIATVVE